VNVLLIEEAGGTCGRSCTACWGEEKECATTETQVLEIYFVLDSEVAWSTYCNQTVHCVSFSYAIPKRMS